MCFSPEASFGLGGSLISIGLACSIAAYKYKRNFIFFSILPIMLGIQQCIEGNIWLLMHAGETLAAHRAAYFYLFFAFAFWPIYMPICAYMVENEINKKRLIGYFMLASPIVSILLYAPVLLRIVPINVTIVNKSLVYTTYQSTALIWFSIIFYGAVVIVPLLISSLRSVRIFGALFLISLLSSLVLYTYAFTSVWCFFAAFLSLYILLMILPHEKLAVIWR